MEPNIVESNLFELQVDAGISAYLRETAKWARFLAILGFILCGLFVIGGLSAGVIINFFMNMNPYSSYGGGAALGAMSAAYAVIFIIMAILYFFPCLYLYNFANKMKLALQNNDQAQLSLSFKNLKSLFRFVGILTIILLSFYALCILIVLAAGLGRH